MQTFPLRALLLAAAVALANPAAALEDWQIAHGPFVTAADVRPHNALPGDIADMRAALATEAPDFAAALDIYAFGRNFPWRERTHSLGRFGDDYNGAMARVLPEAVAHFGGPEFQMAFVFAALAGTSRFQDASPEGRIAAAEAGALATVVNWTRFELTMSESKSSAAEPNWDLSNGSPKNWNEIFAFHFGPEGGNSVHAALEALPGGAEVNAALYDALARGQEQVVAETWPEAEAAEVAALIDRGALLLLADALASAAEAGAAELETAQLRAAGLWLAAAEAVLPRDLAAAETIAAAVEGDPDPALLHTAATAVTEVVDGLDAM